MNVNSVSSVSFKAYIPVKYMAKNDITGDYMPVIDNSNIRKCQSFVVRNLNGTAKNMKNDNFVKFYKAHDKDYARIPFVHSVYDDKSPVVYMVTGSDTDVVKQLAKPVGKAKGEAVGAIGRADSFESHLASRNYFKNVKTFLNRSCRRVKTPDGQPLSLVVYFQPKYKKNNELKGFDFVTAKFVIDEA